MNWEYLSLRTDIDNAAEKRGVLGDGAVTDGERARGEDPATLISRSVAGERAVVDGSVPTLLIAPPALPEKLPNGVLRSTAREAPVPAPGADAPLRLPGDPPRRHPARPARLGAWVSLLSLEEIVKLEGPARVRRRKAGVTVRRDRSPRRCGEITRGDQAR